MGGTRRLRLEAYVQLSMNRWPPTAIAVLAEPPLKASSFVWRTAEGGFALTVLCKITYALRPDVSPLAREQDDVDGEVTHQGGRWPSRHASPRDRVPFKRRAEVIITGHAYGARGLADSAPTARVTVGALSKSLAVGREGLLLPPVEIAEAGEFNSAPRDQQVDRLAPDERILLENLLPGNPRLATRLFGIVPRAILSWPSPERPDQPLALRCDTLWLDTDRGVCVTTWRGAIPIEVAGGAQIRITADGGLAPILAASTGWLDDLRETEVLPLAESTSSAFTRSTIAPYFLTSTGEIDPSALEKARALPFVPAAEGMSLPAFDAVAESEESNRRVTSDGLTGTLVAPLVVPTQALPFERPGAPIAPPPVLTGAPPPPAMLAPVAPDLDDEPPESDPPTPPRPALLGPIAPRPPQVSAEPAEEAAPAIDPEAFPIERWAAIQAELDKGQTPRDEVLRAHTLMALDASAVESHWGEALAREAASRGASLRRAHDEAYVAALERLREAPLSASEYARVLAAPSRAQVMEALRALAMPAQAHMPIVRLWTSKLAREPALSIEVLKAIAEAASPSS